jgi:Zn-dependent protease with chaperone function
MNAATYPAIRFDGRTAMAQEVDVRVEGRTLVVLTRDGIALERIHLDPARVSERFEAAPRIVALDDGGSLEIPDVDGRVDHAFEEAGVAASAVQRLQRFWLGALVSLAGLIGLMAFAYIHGVPAAAHWLAFHLPAGFEERLGNEILRQLDQRPFIPTTLLPEREDEIRRRFAEVAQVAAPGVSYRLAFRFHDGAEGINAMALPGGTIVLLDGLVNIVDDDDNDDALMGVLGHELGHVAGKHSLRQLLQSLGIGALAGLLWGDFSSIVANVPLAFGILRYSREFEREADEYAIALLKANGISARPLLDLFATMESRERNKGKVNPPAFLSTHPPSAERMQRLREAGGR